MDGLLTNEQHALWVIGVREFVEFTIGDLDRVREDAPQFPSGRRRLESGRDDSEGHLGFGLARRTGGAHALDQHEGLLLPCAVDVQPLHEPGPALAQLHARGDLVGP